MNKFFFYGTLRSIPILETVIGHKSDYLEFIPSFAPRSELRLVVNESFPVIVFNDSYEGVHGTLVKGLNGEDINRILFFCSIFTLNSVASQAVPVYRPMLNQGMLSNFFD